MLFIYNSIKLRLMLATCIITLKGCYSEDIYYYITSIKLKATSLAFFAIIVDRIEIIFALFVKICNLAIKLLEVFTVLCVLDTFAVHGKLSIQSRQLLSRACFRVGDKRLFDGFASANTHVVQEGRDNPITGAASNSRYLN